MDTFTQSILGNLVADVLLFGGMGLFSFLYLRLRGKFNRIGSKLQVSPDREKITSEVDGDIFVSDKDGTRNITHSLSVEEGAVWASNSRWIAYAKKTQGQWQVIASDVVTGKVACLSRGMGDARPVEWMENNDLIVRLGGSYLTIYAKEIEMRLR